MENKLDGNDLIYKTGNKKKDNSYILTSINAIFGEKKDKTYGFQNFQTKISLGREICHNDLSLDDALEQQIRLKDDIDIFKESRKPKESVKKKKKH